MLGVCERSASLNGCGKMVIKQLDQTQQVLQIISSEGKEPWAISPFYRSKTSQNCHAGGCLLLRNFWCQKNHPDMQKIHFQKQKHPTLVAPKWSLDVVVAAGK